MERLRYQKPVVFSELYWEGRMEIEKTKKWMGDDGVAPYLVEGYLVTYGNEEMFVHVDKGELTASYKKYDEYFDTAIEACKYYIADLQEDIDFRKEYLRKMKQDLHALQVVMKELGYNETEG